MSFPSALSDEEWIDVLSDDRGRFPNLLPTLPPEEQQKRFCGQSGRPAFTEAVKFYSLVAKLARENGIEIGPSTRIVDLGVGWGRISQSALRDFKPNNIYSVDLHPDAIELCRSTGLRTTLILGEQEPPLPLRTGLADIAMAYSVFSHLSEEAHWKWLRELRRLVRPGGVVVVTTRDRSMIRYAHSLKTAANVPAHAAGLQDAYDDVDEVLNRYDNGEFIFSLPTKTGPLANIYGEAVIPKQYVEREWTAVFRKVQYVTLKESGVGQVVLACVA